MKDKKILIFDGIGGAPMGRELYEEFSNVMSAIYVDGQTLTKKKLSNLRASAAKSINKIGNTDSFYHFPKFKDKSLEEIIQKEKPDIVLVIGFIYRFISPKSVKEMKTKHGFSLFLYDTDSCNFYSRRREFIFFLENELVAYDHIFSFSKVTTDFFVNSLKLSASFLPFGARQIDRPAKVNVENDVFFVGSADLRRIFLLEKLTDHLTVYGNRWEKHKPLMSEKLNGLIIDKPIWGDSLYDQMFKSKIVLNITRTDFYGAETGANLRIYEALAAKCFLLTDYCDELKDIFVLGEEIETYRSSDELQEKVKYYLEHEEERLAIAERGYKRFMKDYTWKARVERFLAGVEKQTS
jgi:spore maturation protein CgeB